MLHPSIDRAWKLRQEELGMSQLSAYASFQQYHSADVPQDRKFDMDSIFFQIVTEDYIPHLNLIV